MNNNRFVAREHNTSGGTDEYKVSTEWECKDTKTGMQFTLYDWKETCMYESDLPSVEEFRMMPEYQWHIGGVQPIDFAGLSQFMSQKLGRPIVAHGDRGF